MLASRCALRILCRRFWNNIMCELPQILRVDDKNPSYTLTNKSRLRRARSLLTRDIGRNKIRERGSAPIYNDTIAPVPCVLRDKCRISARTPDCIPTFVAHCRTASNGSRKKYLFVFLSLAKNWCKNRFFVEQFLTKRWIRWDPYSLENSWIFSMKNSPVPNNCTSRRSRLCSSI